MIYEVILSLEAVEDVLRITIAGHSKKSIVDATSNLQETLKNDPHEAGTHLSEGLYYVDREPLRAFFTIDDEALVIEIVNVRSL